MMTQALLGQGVDTTLDIGQTVRHVGREVDVDVRRRGLFYRCQVWMVLPAVLPDPKHALDKICNLIDALDEVAVVGNEIVLEVPPGIAVRQRAGPSRPIRSSMCGRWTYTEAPYDP